MTDKTISQRAADPGVRRSPNENGLVLWSDQGEDAISSWQEVAGYLASLDTTGMVILGFSPRGNYDPADDYSYLDIVRYTPPGGVEGSYFRFSSAPVTISAIAPEDSEHWALLAEDGLPGADGPPGADGTATGSKVFYADGTIDAPGEVGGAATFSVHENDRDGAPLPLGNLRAGSIFVLSDETNPANYVTWVISAPLTVSNSVFTATATRINGGAIADGAPCRLLISPAGPEGPVGETGGIGPEGPIGPPGQDGNDGVNGQTTLVRADSTSPPPGDINTLWIVRDLGRIAYWEPTANDGAGAWVGSVGGQ